LGGYFPGREKQDVFLAAPIYGPILRMQDRKCVAAQ
jgi:hypothetical protein